MGTGPGKPGTSVMTEIYGKVTSYATGMPHGKRLGKEVGGNKLDDKILQWKKGSCMESNRTIGVLIAATYTFNDCSIPTYASLS